MNGKGLRFPSTVAPPVRPQDARHLEECSGQLLAIGPRKPVCWKLLLLFYWDWGRARLYSRLECSVSLHFQEQQLAFYHGMRSSALLNLITRTVRPRGLCRTTSAQAVPVRTFISNDFILHSEHPGWACLIRNKDSCPPKLETTILLCVSPSLILYWLKDRKLKMCLCLFRYFPSLRQHCSLCHQADRAVWFWDLFWGRNHRGVLLLHSTVRQGTRSPCLHSLLTSVTLAPRQTKGNTTHCPSLCNVV